MLRTGRLAALCFFAFATVAFAGDSLTLDAGGAPRRLAGARALEGDEVPAVQRVLRQHAGELGLDAADVEDLRVTVRRVSLTGTHLELQQYVDGIAVLDGEVSATIDAGELRTIAPRLAHRVVGSRSVATAAPPPPAGTTLVEARSLLLNDAGTMRPVTRLVVRRSPLELYACDYASDGTLLRTIPLFYNVNAPARLFVANPVTTLNNPALRDQENSAAAVPPGAYRDVTLRDLNPAGPLAGPYVSLVDTTDPRVAPVDVREPLVVDRSSHAFEEEMAYFHIDRSNRYVQELGYVGERGIAPYSIPVDAHAESGTDNSHYVPNFRTPGRGALYFGDGGTDDAEDPDIVLHEYAHALQDWIAPNAFSGAFGSESRALSEAISDYWAFSSGYADSVAAGRDPFCIAEWDARCAGSTGCAYPEGSDCLRRVDRAKTMSDFVRVDQAGVEHQNGEIWSSVLRRLFMDSIARFGQERGRRVADTIVLESLFGTPPNPTFATAGRRLVQADLALNGGTFRATICSALRAAAVLDDACGVAPRGEWTQFPSPERNVTIPDATPGGVLLRRVVTDTRIVRRVLVRIDIEHPHRGDLRVSLIGPDGVPVLLQQTSRPDAGSDLHVTFGADVEPQESLAVFAGISAAGVWSLQVIDASSEDVGRVVSWDLFLQLEGDEPFGTRPKLTHSLFFPVVGHAATADARVASSDLFLTNVTEGRAEAILIFTPAGTDGRQSFRAVRLDVGAHEEIALDDVVTRSFFGGGIGTLQIESDRELSAVSRVTRTSSFESDAQTVMAIDRSSTAGANERLVIARLVENDHVRSNIGVANLTAESAIVDVLIYQFLPSSVRERLAIPPHSVVQIRAGRDAHYAVVQVIAGSVSAYGSIIDAATGESTVVPGKRRDAERVELHGVVVRGRGAGGEEWRSDLTIVNDDFVTITVEAGNIRRTWTTGPSEFSTISLNDLARTALGADFSGVARLTLSSSSPIDAVLEIVASKDGTEHHDVFPLLPRSALTARSTTFALPLEATRHNVGVSNLQSTSLEAIVETRDRAGTLLSTERFVVAPHAVLQRPLSAAAAGGSVTLRGTESPVWIPYVSSVGSGGSLIQVGDSYE